MQDVPRAVGQIIAEYTFSEKLLEMEREGKMGYALQYEVGLPVEIVDIINQCLFDRRGGCTVFEIQHQCGDGKWIMGRLGPLKYNGKYVVHRPMKLRISWGSQVVCFEKQTDCIFDMTTRTLRGLEEELTESERIGAESEGADVPGTRGSRAFRMIIDDRMC